MPRTTFISVLILFASSFFVYVEPAPFDLLVVCTLVAILAQGRSFILEGMWFPCITLAVFVLANFPPMMTGVVLDYDRALFYITISIYLIGLFYVVAVLVSRYGEAGAEAVLAGCAFAAVMSSVVGIAAFSGSIPGMESLLFAGRAMAFFKDPNVFGPFLGLALVWLVYKFDNCRNSRRRIFIISVICICAVGIIVSFSRGAWIGVITSLVVYYGIQAYRQGFYRYLRNLSAPILVAVVTVTAIGFLNPSQMNELFYPRLKAQNYDEDRFYVQHLALEKSVLNPLGLGPGQSELSFIDVSRLGTASTHSLFMRLMFENGWVGVLSFIIFLFLTGRVVLRCSFGATPSAPVAAVVLAVFMGTMVQGFVIDTLHWRHLWILCGLAWGLHVHDLKVPARLRAAWVGAARS